MNEQHLPMPPRSVVLRFPPRLSLARLPTPLQPLERLRAAVGGPRIWVKRDDLSDCAVSGNKVRKLEFTLAQALGEGADTLLSCGGLQSNHCRATALLGARLGLQVHLLLRGEQRRARPMATCSWITWPAPRCIPVPPRNT